MWGKMHGCWQVVMNLWVPLQAWIVKQVQQQSRGEPAVFFIAAVLFVFYVIAGTRICMLVFTDREGTVCLVG